MSKTRRGTRARGTGYSGPDSTKPAQRPEANRANDWSGSGGSAPGGLTSFPLTSGQGVSTSRPNANDEPMDADAARILAQGHPKSVQVKRSW